LAPESASNETTRTVRSPASVQPESRRSDPPTGNSPRPDVFDTRIQTLQIRGVHLRILSVRDTNALIDRISPEEFSVDERLPYWAELWPSSQVLGEYCLSTIGRNRSFSVLELGTGLGVAGICAALAGADVLMTDYEPDALIFARHNLGLNISEAQMRDRVRLRLLDWRMPDLDEKFDLVIGSDILYERKHFDPILGLLPVALRPGGLGVFTDPCRSTLPDFLREAQTRGFRPAVGNVTLGQRTISRVELPIVSR
jgi:predicted nicotinamide N-methyase